MFDNLFKEVMIFIDEILQDRENYVKDEKKSLLNELKALQAEKDNIDGHYEDIILNLKKSYDIQIFDLKEKLQEEKKEKKQLEEGLQELQFTLNGLLNVNRRNEVFEKLKEQLLDLEKFINQSEKQRNLQFNATKEVMSYIHTAADMIPKFDDVSVQAGHTTVPYCP